MFTSAKKMDLEKLLSTAEKLVQDKLEAKDNTEIWQLVSTQLQLVGGYIRSGQNPSAEVKEKINFGPMLAKTFSNPDLPQFSILFRLYEDFQNLGIPELPANSARRFFGNPPP